MATQTNGPILRSPKGNLEIVAIYDNKGKSDPLRGRSFPELFSLGGNLVTYRQLGQFFADNSLWVPNKKILTDASPMATRTVGALSRKLPLNDPSLRDESGKIYIEGEFNGRTRFGGFTVDQLVKAGVNVETPGVLLAMERGYTLGDANANGSSYTMRVADMPPEQLKALLYAFYGDFSNGQLRRTNNALLIPAGDVVSGSPSLEALYFNYLKPGPAVPGDYLVLDFIYRFYVDFGDAYGDDRFGGAAVMQDLKSAVLEGINALLATKLGSEQKTIVNAMREAAERD